jgi:CDP-diacylglycerol---glycerol-3-phosphate 3-phosphatidyltransferase
MFTLPNLISFLRFPLAFLFLYDSIILRICALALAGISDALDGYLARKFKMQSRFGTTLDPIMDKFFVVFVILVLMNENNLGIGEALTMVSRDLAVVCFGLYLAFTRQFSTYKFRSIWSGKATTFLQLFVLFGLTYHIDIPVYAYGLFVVLGLLSFFELYMTRKAFSC